MVSFQPLRSTNTIKTDTKKCRAMGTSDGNPDANLHYPLAFHAAFLSALASASRQSPSRFRYIHLSGALCVQDQSASLWFLSAPRKIKGLAETKMLEFAKDHADRWQTFIVKPGGVLREDAWYVWPAAQLLGQDSGIKGVELGSTMAELAVSGERHKEEEGIILNRRIIEMGREILRV
jgi:hypothetical protein